MTVLGRPERPTPSIHVHLRASGGWNLDRFHAVFEAAFCGSMPRDWRGAERALSRSRRRIWSTQKHRAARKEEPCKSNGNGGAPVLGARPKLKRSIGLWMATALVVGNMVGSGIFTLPAVLAGEAGPASIVALALHRRRRDAARARLRQPRPRAIRSTGGPYYFARRAFGDFVGFQTAWAYWIAAWVGNAAIAVAFAGYLGVFWGDVNTNNWLAALVAVGAIWLFTLREHPRRARDAASRRSLTTVLKFVPLAVIGIDRPLLHRRRQLHAVHAGRGRVRLAHQRRRDARALGLHRPRVGDGAGRGGQGPGEDDSAGDDPRHARHDAALHRRARRDHRRPVAGRARRLVGAVRRRRERDVGRHLPRPQLGQVDRARRDGRDARCAQRLDHADGARVAGGRGRRAVPEAVRPRARRAADAGLRAARLVRARQRARALQLERQLRRPLHGRRPARDLDDADRVRVRGGRGGRALLPRAASCSRWAKLGARLGDRRAGVRLLGLGDLGLRRGVAGQGLHAPALRHPGLRLDEVAPDAGAGRARRRLDQRCYSRAAARAMPHDDVERRCRSA